MIPRLGIPAKRVAGPSKPTLSPVPLVSSGQDQARFPPSVEEPWAGPEDPIITRQSSAMLTAITSKSLATADASRLLLTYQQTNFHVDKATRTFVDDLSGPSSHRPAISRARAAEGKVSRACLRPYRHETYAIGITESAARRFRYRGAERVSTRGASRGPRPAVAARSVSAPLPAALSAAAARAVDARTSPGAGLGGRFRGRYRPCRDLVGVVFLDLRQQAPQRRRSAYCLRARVGGDDNL